VAEDAGDDDDDVAHDEDHEDGRDKAVELVDIAAEVDEFFLQAGDDGGVEAEGVGGNERRVRDARGLWVWRGSAGGGLVWLAGRPAVAQSAYPSKTVKMIVPYPAGGSVDGVARIIAQELNVSMGQNFVVENDGTFRQLVWSYRVRPADSGSPSGGDRC